MSDFEVEKTLVSSTTHVSQSDFSLLGDISEMPSYISAVREGGDIPFYVYQYEYGLILRLAADFNLSEFPADLYSEGLQDLVIFCVSLGCSGLKLDCDGPVYSGFKIYDW
tara:strand:+ start:1272 stop:1601 length:330 start_codon:yes stop_codon:yes gene_type:complete